MIALNEEQIMLRDSAYDWAQECSPVNAFRKLRDSQTGLGYDPEAWHHIAEMGWPGIVVPESQGGLEFGHRSLGLVLEALARTLTASPLLSCAAVANAIVLGDNQSMSEEWLPKLALGEAIGALACDETARHNPERVSCEIKDGYLSGKKLFVHEGNAADVLIVTAKLNGNIELFAIPTTTKGIKRTPLDMSDSRDTAHIEFDSVAIDPTWQLKGGKLLLTTVLNRARIYAAAEMQGLARQAFETTVEYLKVRSQYGQLIGAFQALQHRAAKMFTELELTQSCVDAALDAIDEGDENISEMASVAQMMACETTNLVTNEMIQMHGGVGMTDEHDAGFYLKRARVLEAWLGNAAFHRERFAVLNAF
ncbi:acyl-CoA dehydrogenase family protein [Alteromonas lipolytica]|uniref:Acyl-CoA dehydrogenase n=1 Tax=Alteromonas lipolytica TaxID=1856405 RepID=A0A1E8FEF8_9ALTE|nr:acyl-CoA dehydrogenase family protein [Alteromonas lipolytica]OFI34312.1 acyl-CoA dehydrogenase [Alteromonas lipolytica]GGF82554.1 acyl-CoA dehydrogenase [Alteromonas lipolytica]